MLGNGNTSSFFTVGCRWGVTLGRGERRELGAQADQMPLRQLSTQTLFGNLPSGFEDHFASLWKSLVLILQKNGLLRCLDQTRWVRSTDLASAVPGVGFSSVGKQHDSSMNLVKLQSVREIKKCLN